MGSSATVSAVAVGVVVLVFPSNKTLVLTDVLYAPSIRRNLISVSSLVNNGYSFHFGTEVSIKRNGSFICSGTLSNGLYLINHCTQESSKMELNNSLVVVPSKRKERSSNPTKLWHLRLGHINLNKIDRLVKEGILNS